VGRTVVVEFPDRRTALEWYRGESYTEARKIREGAAIARIYLVDGTGPPEVWPGVATLAAPAVAGLDGPVKQGEVLGRHFGTT
jgi:hypothetical protein